MNLRWVHAFLILLSAALAVVFGLYSLAQYQRDPRLVSLITGIGAFVASFGLVVYDRWFLRKTRMLR